MPPEIIQPNAPTITIRLLPNGQLMMSGPTDKILTLGMLSLAAAAVQRECMNPQIPMSVQ